MSYKPEKDFPRLEHMVFGFFRRCRADDVRERGLEDSADFLTLVVDSCIHGFVFRIKEPDINGVPVSKGRKVAVFLALRTQGSRRHLGRLRCLSTALRTLPRS